MSTLKLEPTETKLDTDLQTVARGNRQFAWNLFRQLSCETEGNLFFSPWSISTALAMTYSGAKGKTATEMADVLGVSSHPVNLHATISAHSARLTKAAREHDMEFQVANRLWVQQGFALLQNFTEQMARDYGAPVEQLDFGARPEQACQRMNQWVADQTADKVRKLLEPEDIQALTTLILINAICFKADWAFPFELDETTDAPFYVTSTDQVNVPFMRQVNHFGFVEDTNVQVVELPYVGESLSMMLILPQKGKTLKDLDSQLTSDNVRSWSEQLVAQKVEVVLPRFQLSKRIQLKPILQSMGMSSAFTGDADFSGIEPQRLLFIGSVIHQAFVDVNEQGTEAAAATAVMMIASGRPIPPPVFRADRPFVCVIQDRATGNVLFLGHLVDPSSR